MRIFWLFQSVAKLLCYMCSEVIKCGPIPRHIAFIMDGNRRYATKNNMPKIAGASSGKRKLTEVRNWCVMLGIKEVTVFALSVDNFNRTQEEVDVLINLAREYVHKLLRELSQIQSLGMRVRFIGCLHMLPEEMQKSMDELMRKTRDNDKMSLNIVIAYSSRQEIITCLQNIVQEVKNGTVSPDEISEDMLSRYMYAPDMSNPDLLIRTSGVFRLSDLFLWRVSSTCIYFSESMWPEFDFWSLALSILYYQRCYGTLREVNRVIRFLEK